MSLDPLELKKMTLKRAQQVKQIQEYREEQDKLDKEDATGTLGAHRVNVLNSEEGKISSLTSMILNNQKSAGTDGGRAIV